MSEFVTAVGAGVLWGVPFLVLAVAVSRSLGVAPGPAVLAAYPVFFTIQVLLAKGASATEVLTTPVFRAVYGAAFVGGIGWLLLSGERWSSLWHGRLPFPGTSGPERETVDGTRGPSTGDADDPGDPGDPDDPDDADDSEADVLLIRRLVLGLAFVILAALAVFTLLTPVRVWDVLAYHMPMVASYFQNGSLAAWPTQDLRQIVRVNAGELQLLNVALLARSDSWVALPNLLALGVFLCGTLELSRLAFTRPALSYVAVALVLTAPQIVVGAGTAKNDLMFSAVLLGAFYWMIRAGLEADRGRTAITDPQVHERRRPLSMPVPLMMGLAGLSGALAAATKVLGLNVLGAAGLLALALAVRGRLAWRQVLVFGGVGSVALLVLAGDIYWSNLFRTAVPVGIAPGEIHFTFGLANLVEAARYYVYDLSIRRLVAPQIFEHDFLHYGYLFPFLIALAAVGAVRQVRERNAALVALTLGGALLFLSVIAVRQPIRWDQRFMIWIVPAAAILALSVTRFVHIRHLIAMVGLAAGLALAHLSLMMSMEADSLFPRSASHLAHMGSPARYIDVPNGRYMHRSDGFDVLDREAAPGDSVLYAGVVDSWMYLAWGPRFSRHVEGVQDAAHASEQVASGRFRFIVMETSVLPGIRGAIQEQASMSGYGVLVEADGRIILAREGNPGGHR